VRNLINFANNTPSIEGHNISEVKTSKADKVVVRYKVHPLKSAVANSNANVIHSSISPKLVKEVGVVCECLALKARCGVDFQHVGPLLSLVVDHVYCPEVETTCTKGFERGIKSLNRKRNVVTSKYEPVVVVAHLPVDFIIRNITTTPLLLHRDSVVVTINQAAMNTILCILLDVLGVQRGRHKLVTVVGNHNTSTTVAVKDGTTHNRKRSVSKIICVTCPLREYIPEALFCQQLKKRKFVGHPSNVFWLVKEPVSPLPKGLSWHWGRVGVTPVDNNVIKARAEPRALKTHESAVREGTSESRCTAAPTTVRDYTKAGHIY